MVLWSFIVHQRSNRLTKAGVKLCEGKNRDSLALLRATMPRGYLRFFKSVSDYRFKRDYKKERKKAIPLFQSVETKRNGSMLVERGPLVRGGARRKSLVVSTQRRRLWTCPKGRELMLKPKKRDREGFFGARILPKVVLRLVLWDFDRPQCRPTAESFVPLNGIYVFWNVIISGTKDRKRQDGWVEKGLYGHHRGDDVKTVKFACGGTRSKR
ncbi:hypothetical protein V1477_000926 [Vespula maculifrons]|uniref:Uncharacterized protein n=1 Tax=Vespula maculifrons TaxID=7453 RepID=A0ABD2D0A6_VESMC